MPTRRHFSLLPLTLAAGMLLTPGIRLHGADAEPADLEQAIRESEAYPDERAAMAAVAQDPTPENKHRLATLRLTYAMRFAENARQTRNPALLRTAAAYAKTATELEPENAEGWWVTGLLFYHLQPDDPRAATLAEQALRRAVALDADRAVARLQLGQLLMEQERYDEGLDHLAAALQANPRFAEPPMLSALLVGYTLLGRTEEGERTLAALLKAAPTDAVRLSYAVLLNHNGKLKPALTEVNRVVRDEKADPKVREYATWLRETFTHPPPLEAQP